MTEGEAMQPLLHNSVVLLCAPSQLWCAPSGELRGGIHGFFHGEWRLVSGLRLLLGSETPERIATSELNSSSAVFTSIVREPGAGTADPRLLLSQRRTVGAGELTETVTVQNGRTEALQFELCVELIADFAPMQEVRSGLRAEHSPNVELLDAGLQLQLDELSCQLIASDAAIQIDGNHIRLLWPVAVEPGESVEVEWSLSAHDAGAVVAAAPPAPHWRLTPPGSTDSRLSAWLHRALDDLHALRTTSTAAPGEVFLAAGAPWYFTLFGRDAIWAARMLLPVDRELAASTLRALAALQGMRDGTAAAEQPGKILHELRPTELSLPGEGVRLPPRYYGTVDATPLWVCLLHDAWRAGMPEQEVAALLPNLEAALGWIGGFGDGYLEYTDTTGHGLANQGWKDSTEAIQFSSGEFARGPIALSEVQGYAYAAALGGAELLEAFGRPAAHWREWAARLQARFSADFWIDDVDGGYPALALDAERRRIDAVASNMGHLLGTGILSPEQSATVARRLVSPELSSGFGLRTLSTQAVGYWPLSYHCGSVWPHDTAIAISGLQRDGHLVEARQLADGLLVAAAAFDFRIPELYSGAGVDETVTPIPYPTACRPQAWSAAAAAVLWQLEQHQSPAS